ncbi:N-acetyltransferase [Shewanella inventionis]|uniref:N-acetyltransferase n=1 Tax=Shewanella inventionis TaxID=1738770 RepID=A0ABQ1J182_9GAMM|nr:GNAT family N-acetyltransferase [Shewanella inventionis]MCL1157534.1 N-acetyltransferase [Shewanella inventionis]UAL43594.1 N-acetyltransferase [Shewanella inventionis]GGB57639.1 N-acetyltransferase [Shewanella inventionis]
MNSQDTVSVAHQAEQHRFVVNINGAQALLEYHLTGKNIDFHRTFVPPELRGKGIAEKLVRTGLAWAKSEGLTINASCSYVVKFLS